MQSESGNRNLRAARAAKNDEFYTQRADIEAELFYYRKYFAGKTVYCNCDDPTASHFYAYFRDNFALLKLRKVIAATYRNPDPDIRRGQTDLIAEEREKYAAKKAEKANQPAAPIKQRQAVCIEYTGNKTGRPRTMRGDGWYHGGDFRSKESIALLKQADIVCTNPPFSLFREYVAQLFEYKKDFLILGNMNAITYKEIFPLFMSDKVWLGMSPRGMDFKRPDGTLNSVNACWYTNLDHDKRHADLRKRLYQKYDPEKYPKYDNYDAIEVGSVANIPLDYDGMMGVPVTFMDKYNPEQFEILGQPENENLYGLRTRKYTTQEKKDAYFKKFGRSGVYDLDASAVLVKSGQLEKMFKRILVRHKHPRD